VPLRPIVIEKVELIVDPAAAPVVPTTPVVPAAPATPSAAPSEPKA
jgi:hypothetical protein